MTNKIMKIEDAMQIVYDLADQNKIDAEWEPDMKEEAEKQQLALDTVHDFIVNNFGE